MAWWEQLGKDNRGSRPRCVLLMDGKPDVVAERLTRLVNLPGVLVSSDDKWMPYGKPVRRNGLWDKSPANEAQLDKARDLMSDENRRHLREWWLAVWGRGGRTTTPNWDIASTCRIDGKPGLLLVEAKAHENELEYAGKDLNGGASENSQKNHTRIGHAIRQARTELQSVIGGHWAISRDECYQLSNRLHGLGSWCHSASPWFCFISDSWMPRTCWTEGRLSNPRRIGSVLSRAIIMVSCPKCVGDNDGTSAAPP